MRRTNGSIAVYVILISISTFIVLLALLQQTSGIFTNTRERAYLQLAQEAAEAGSVYAVSCLNANNHHQSWGADYYGGGGADRPNLTPASDCEGTANIYPSAAYVYSDDHVRTYFSVTALSSNSVDNGAVLSVIGYAEILGNGSVVDTYQYGLKKNIAWNTTAVAGSSTSGANRTCAVIQSSIYCWGENTYGQLGNGSTADSTLPVAVTRAAYPGGIGSKPVTNIAAGEYFNCALISTGEAYCWGRNDKGQLGQGDYTDSSVPVRVQGSLAGKTVTAITTTSTSACALTNTGDVYCWGNGESGQLGNNASGGTNIATSPVLIAGPSIASGGGDIGTTAVSSLARSSAYANHTCAIANTNLYCWGENGDGELGLGDYTDRAVPAAVNGGGLSGRHITMVSAEGTPGVIGTDDDGDAHTCAVAYVTSTSDAKAFCWGSNSYGQIGNGSTDYSARVLTPTAISTAGDLSGAAVATAISTSSRASCVTAYTSGDTTTTRAYCWGTKDEIGAGDSVSPWNSSPIAIDDATGTLASNKTAGLRASAHQSCASAAGHLYCWGGNTHGQLGDSTTDSPHTLPVESLYLKTGQTEYIY